MSSSVGSKVTLGANTLHTTLVDTETGSRDVEATGSQHTATNYDAIIPDNMATISGILDPTNTPEAVGFVPGTKVNCVCFDGTTGKTTSITGGLVGKITRTRDVANDVIRFRFQIKGGAHTLN